MYQHYAYWCDKGNFERLFQGLQLPDMEEVMIDSTCCKAHQASAGARKKLSPFRRLNTKLHALCDALGNPLRFLLTQGQRHDSKAAPELLEGVMANALLADKAYDSDKIIQLAQGKGIRTYAK